MPTISHIHDISYLGGIDISDSTTLLDILSKNINKFLTESSQVSEKVVKNINKSVSDIMSISENTSLVKSFTRAINDIVSISEESIKTTHLQIDDLLFNDSIKTAIKRSISILDNATINEFSGKNIPKTISDGLSFSDISISTVYRNYVRSVIDILNSGDSTSRQIGKMIQETPQMMDSIAKEIFKVVSDGIVPIEILSLDVKNMLLEQTRTIRPNTNINLEAEGALVNL